jgi:hypothetical protein
MTAPTHEASPWKIFMPEGYCVKCKAKKEIIDAVEEVMKNGRKAIKGKCPTCGTVMFKILGGKASTAAAPATPAAPASPAAEPTTPKAS